MRIWIDGLEANVPQRLGSSQVAFELLKNISQIDKDNDYTILLPSQPLSDLPKEADNWGYRILRPRRLWTRIALPLALFRAKIKPDLVFSPTHYVPRFSPVPRVVTIFDLAFLHFPSMFKTRDRWQLKNWSEYSIKNSRHIIAISESTKRDLISNYPGSEGKITVCYPGYDQANFYPVKDKGKIGEVVQKYGIEGPFILFIGTIQPRKNLGRLIEAFKNIDGLKLVVVGKTSGSGRQAWMYQQILNLPKKLRISNKVVFTGFVPDGELVYLMNGAMAFILPSLWEGFGIPVLEAMASGTPVIASNVSSLPEVVGNAGLLIDPKSLGQIEQAIMTIATDSKLRKRLSVAGLKQSQKFSWKKMAREVVKVFDKVR